MNRIFTWLRSLREKAHPAIKINLDQWILDNKEYEYRLERRKATLENTSDLINNFA